MEKEKKNKILKATGLILLTIIVVVSVILIVHFTEQTGAFETKNTDVGIVNETSYGSFVVNGRELINEVNGKKPKEGNIFLVLNMTFNATKSDVKISRDKLNLSGYKGLEVEGYLVDDIKVKKGNNKDVSVLFELPVSNNQLYLYYKGYRVRLGNSWQLD